MEGLSNDPVREFFRKLEKEGEEFGGKGADKWAYQVGVLRSMINYCVSNGVPIEDEIFGFLDQ